MIRCAIIIVFGALVGHFLFFKALWKMTDNSAYCVPRSVTTYKPRILCFINTYPGHYDQKAIHAQRTWARKCDRFFFTSTVAHKDLSLLVLNLGVPEIKGHLWVKMREILRQVYKLIDQYDYFYKADDDTYVVVENLRTSLKFHSPDDPFMTGYRWRSTRRNGFLSGGSGYLMSREALKRLMEQAIDKHPDCPTTDEHMEDVKMSQCGEIVGVRLLDELGETNESLYAPYNLSTYFSDRFLRAEARRKFKPENTPFIRRDKMRFSSRHISFHHVENYMMYIHEFLLYYMNPLQSTLPEIQSVPKSS